MLQELKGTMSDARLATYLVAAGHDDDRALEIYRWNVKLGESFHLPIQAVEIALRNRIDAVLCSHFCGDWWRDAAFEGIATCKQKAQIQETRQRISRRGADMVTGQIVAGLSFGFWVSMLDKRFFPTVWSKSLATAFPHLPKSIERQEVQTTMRRIADFRNRIWHHEPIFKDNTTARYSDCMTALGWLSMPKKQWVKPQCTVMSVVRAKP